jgi:heme exporter protein C
VDVPVVYFSVTWWRTVHPGSIVVSDALPAAMLGTFLLTMACTLVLAATLIAIRYRIETLQDARERMPVRSVVVSARGELGSEPVR